MRERYDAIVIGGGPSGTSAALLLARAGWSVALVERKEFPRRKVCGEYMSATNLPLFDRLGIGEHFRALAGPPVTRVGIFAGRTLAESPLPALTIGRIEWGRALSRQHLDTWLLEKARAHGVDVWQPWSVEELSDQMGDYVCVARSVETGAATTLRAPIVIAAHGSWDPGQLPTQPARMTTSPSDLLAFKAHFRKSELPDGLMPLLAFPGGYGGMVHCEEGNVSLSCCIRRDRLAEARRRWPGDAGDAVLAHIQVSCLGVSNALASARREGAWLAAGPIRPGLRVESRGGVFRVGNAAGEAHPVVAEGISMALQSSWLLAKHLIAWRTNGAHREGLGAVQERYATAWRRSFAPRIAASFAIAHWAMSPTGVSLTLPVIRWFPSLLTLGARMSGKVRNITR